MRVLSSFYSSSSSCLLSFYDSGSSCLFIVEIVRILQSVLEPEKL